MRVRAEKTLLTLIATRPMWGMAFLRLIFGLTLILDGISRYRFLRHEPDALINALTHEWAIALVISFSVIEIIAGVFAFFGFAIRGVGAVIMFEMLVSILFERAPLEYTRDLETQVLLLSIAVMMFFSGAGRYSLDRFFARKLLKKHPNLKKELYMIAETPHTKWWE